MLQDDDGDSAGPLARAGHVSDSPRVRDGDDVTTGTGSTPMRMSAADSAASSTATAAARAAGPSGKLIGLGYEKRGEIGRGTYGTVYDGVHVASQRHVAIKKVIGRAAAGEAEAALLRACDGADHVVQLLDVVRRNGKVYLVLEFMDSDLETVIKATDHLPRLEIAHVKAYLQMLLRGVQELHDRKILHRDLKPNNLLVEKHGRVAKLTDFGMATQVASLGGDDGEDGGDEDERKLSIQVVTRAYRAPELFFGQDRYGTEVDMWSVGCIFAEMLLRKPFFDGASDIDQLSLIFAALGSPNENGWHAAAELPFHLKFKDTNPTPLRDQFPELSAAGVDLLSKLLQVDPAKRLASAADALQHAFFSEEPAPARDSEVPIVLPVDPSKKRPLAEVIAESRAVREGNDDDEDEADEDVGRIAIKGRRIL